MKVDYRYLFYIKDLHTRNGILVLITETIVTKAKDDPSISGPKCWRDQGEAQTCQRQTKRIHKPKNKIVKSHKLKDKINRSIIRVNRQQKENDPIP